MATVIPLTQGQFAIVDDEDVLFLCQWKWCFDGRYAMQTSRAGQKIYMHRVILERKLGQGDFEECDHIDRDRLNNKRANLRPATHAQNCQNCSKHKNNTSGYKGVSWCKEQKKWAVHMRVKGKTKYLGRFDRIGAAARMYDIFAKKYHGEFAQLNFGENT